MIVAINRFLKKRTPGVHRRVRRAIRWILLERYEDSFQCPAVLRRLGTYWVWCHPRFLTEDLRIEEHVRKFIGAHLNPGEIFFDLGGYVGWHAIFGAKCVEDEGRVVCFEPSPSNLKYLSYHQQKNAFSQMQIENRAVSHSSEGEVSFQLFNKGDSSSNSLTFNSENVRENTTKVKVSTVTLDDYTREHQLRPKLIKIDVEGAELGVLHGAKSVLEISRPILILAVHPHWLPTGQETEDILGFLRELGYRVEDEDGKEVNELELAEYFCFPQENDEA